MGREAVTDGPGVVDSQELTLKLLGDRSLFMWGGGGDFFCFSMKEKT